MRLSRLAAAFAVALSAAACQNAPPPVQKLPELSFTQQRPFQLDVGQLEIVSEFVSPGRSPNIEHLMPLSPQAAAQRWAQDRLRPMGRLGMGRVVIRDARVVEVPLTVDKSFSGNFKKEQEYRYDGALEVAVQILDARHMVVAETTARASRSKTVTEGISLNQRERTLYDISDGLARDIDDQMNMLIRNYLGRWIVQ